MGKAIYMGASAITAVVFAIVMSPPAQATLKSPFARAEVIAAAPAGPPKSDKCAPAPAVVRDIETVSKYGENRREHGSTVIDPEAADRYAEDTGPLIAFTRRVSTMADGAVVPSAGSARNARCAMAWLNSWAQQDGMLGQVNPAGESIRKWELASLATAYLKIRSARQDPERSSRVRRWLQRVGTAVEQDYSRNTGADSRSNNHLNWAAWAVMAAAIAADDHEMFDWSVDRFRYALAKIEPDGTLPLEVKRRQRAFAYHNFALGPLIMLREGAYANGVVLSPAEEQRLQALIDLVIDGLDDPAFIERKAGVPQVIDGIDTTHFAWLEPYYARTGDPRAKRLLDREDEPFKSARLGGDLTALYGQADGAPAPARQ